LPLALFQEKAGHVSFRLLLNLPVSVNLSAAREFRPPPSARAIFLGFVKLDLDRGKSGRGGQSSSAAGSSRSQR
jgi:hypothetical protein